MKIYGSLTNRLEENRNYTGREIKVGDYATVYLYSDSHAYEVIEVKNQKHIFIRRLKAIRADNNGISECQTYKYESDENNKVIEVKKGKKYWREKGYREYNNKNELVWKWVKINISFGIADEYFDYSF